MHVSRLKAFAVSAELSVLFLVVYSGCNWITGQRSQVGSFYFQWERAIPFVPFMVLPYMSIDLFFIAAPFLCRTEEGLRIFSRRVIAAILIAGFCFLLFPLRFAFPRPHANGWLGAVFDWFRGVDLPFNLFPSLHAALLLLLVDVYARNLRGVPLWAVMSWFFLIALSPLLTYQHHVIDIVGGFVLAGYCFYLFREPYARAAGCRESPHRFVLRSGSGGCLDYGHDLLAMGSPASLASDRSRHRGDRVLQSGSDRFSQD